jgi:peptidoglycan/LPS O-acetylase OafA/YrhL
LFLVLAAVGIYAALFVADTRKSALRSDAWSTVAYVANWRFAYSGQSYFDQFSEPSPLLHMWSLGIEEQFYWLFPLLLVVWFRLRKTTRGLALLCAAGAAASALVMALRYEPSTDPSRLYFGTDTRAQAILVGAALAVWMLRRRPATAQPRTAVAVGPFTVEPQPGMWLGLACLTLLAVTFVAVHESDAWLYHGGFLAIAVVTAGVIFAAAGDDRTATQRVLSVEPLRRIGLISYGLYLWHWPVFIALSPTRTGLAPLPLTVARFAVTFGLAYLSYRFVEQPIRQGALRRRLLPVPRRVFVASGLAAVVAVVFVGTAGAVSSPTPLGGDPSAVRAASNGQHQATAFLVGDSIALNLRANFPADRQPGLQVSGSTVLGCGLTPAPVSYRGVSKPLDPACPLWSQAWPVEVQKNRPDVGLVMAGTHEQWDHVVDGNTLRFGTAAYRQHIYSVLDASVDPFRRQGAAVAVSTVPCHRVIDTGTSPDGRVINDESRIEWINGVLHAYTRERHIPLVDLYGFLCSQGYQESRDGVKLRTDGMHFTPDGARIVWDWLGPQLRALATAAQSRGPS